MGFFGWLRAKTADRVDPRLIEWQREWTAAAASGDSDGLTVLHSRLDAIGLPDEEIEIEREMLDGLRELMALRSTVASNGLPVLETGHRVIGSDRLHFSAPVSMPDDPAQPGGRLLLTGSRAIFVGGARTTTVPWHAVGEARHDRRDVVLVRKDRENLYRFRCNSFADALCGAYTAHRLAAVRQPATATEQPRT
jgi:hypothetical protein